MGEGSWRKMLRTIVLFALLSPCSVLAQDATSLLTGLLSTFASSSRNPGCPGECRHALSALFCSHILDDADCGDSQLRCCTNPPATPPPPPRPQRPSSTNPPRNFSSRPAEASGSALDGRRPLTNGEHIFNRPPMLDQSSPISVVTNLTVRPNQAKPLRPKPVSRIYPKRRSTTSTPVAVKNRTAMTTAVALPLPTAAAITAGGNGQETSNINDRNSNNNSNDRNTNSNNNDRNSNNSNNNNSNDRNNNNVNSNDKNNNNNVNDHNRNSNGNNNNNDRNTNNVNSSDRNNNNNNNGNDDNRNNNNNSNNNINNNNSKKPCEGMCVSNFVASFCSRTSESSHCSPGETCCFTESEEDGQPEPLTTSSPASLTPRPPVIDPPKTSIPPKTSVPPRTSGPPKTTGPPRPSPSGQPVVTKVPPRQPDLEEAVAECPGTCVMGLLYLLCADVDRTVSCENGGKCCISKNPEEEMAVSTTVKPPAVRECPGICLPSLLSGVCNRPAILLPDTLDCEAGSICCDNSLREAGQAMATTTTTTSSPLLDMLSWPLKLGALGAAAGLGQQKPSSDDGQLAATTSLIGPLVELFTGGGAGQNSPHKDGQLFGGGGQAGGSNGGLFGGGQTGGSNGGLFGGGQGSGQDGGSNVGQFFGGQGSGQGSGQAGGQYFGSQGDGQGSGQAGGQLFGGQGSGQAGGQLLGGQGGGQAGGLNGGQLFGGQGGGQGSGPNGDQFFGGQGSGQFRPPPPPNRFAPPPPPSSSTSGAVDRMQTDQHRPKCPGTCIASFLKMTCFGSSQLTDAFSCPKENLLCCAPKSAFLGPQLDATVADAWNSTLGRYPATDASAVGFSQRPSVNKYVCGMKGAARPETPRVVGGRDGSPGEWCWQVALINSLNQYLCGGALIGRQWVLTAAHCVTNLIRSGDAIYVRVGDYDLTSKYGSPGAQTLRVATTYIHHNHNSQTLDNNVALLKLDSPAELRDGVCLVCLPARGVAVEAGKRCVVTGYGYMGESGPIPLRVREAMLPIVSEQECVRKINSVTEKIFILPASSFCAGGEEGHDACQGDGGGPLSCEVDGYYELTGIVSWGFGCGRADVPGIYVKISSFIGWINQIISVNSI